MKKAIKKLIKEKSQFEADLEDADAEIEELKDKVKDYKHRLEDYKEKLEESRSREVKLKKLIELMQIKRTQGVVAAAQHLKQPMIDNIAESESIRSYREPIPRQEHIAEKKETISASGLSSNFFKKPLALPVQSVPVQVQQMQQVQQVQQLQQVQQVQSVKEDDMDIFQSYSDLLG